MIKVYKGIEPPEWKSYRQTEGVHYQAIPELREQLKKDQGYICAYCMSEIPNNDGSAPFDTGDNPPKHRTRIDHVYPRHPELTKEPHTDEEKEALRLAELDYNNMVMCCSGAISEGEHTPKEYYHCDKRKENHPLSFDVFSGEIVETLSYSSYDGHISSSNPQWNNEIDKLLNLNSPLLMKKRYLVLVELYKTLEKFKVQRIYGKEVLETLQGKWENRDERGCYKPYCGVVVRALTNILQTL